jgi:uncharacterized membrane protein YkoI
MERGMSFATIMADLVALAALLGAGCALAQNNNSPPERAAVIADAGTATARAIAGVERQSGGKVVEFDIVDQNGTSFVEIEVLSDGQGNHVLVDRRSGKVIGMVPRPKRTSPEFRLFMLSNTRLRAATATELSVPDVIAAVDKYSIGGKVLEVSFEPTASAATYLLKILQKDAIWEGSIDANSGEMLGTGKSVPASKLDLEGMAELSSVDTATTIVQAVRIAELHARGKAIAISIGEAEAGGAIWEVVVVNDGIARRVVVDPATGQARTGSGWPAGTNSEE